MPAAFRTRTMEGTDASLSPPNRTTPPDALIAALPDSLQTCDLPNCETIKFCCFKPLKSVVICHGSRRKLIRFTFLLCLCKWL